MLTAIGIAFIASRLAIIDMLGDQQAPFGGFKRSGVGHEFDAYGIEAFLEPKAILEINAPTIPNESN